MVNGRVSNKRKFRKITVLWLLLMPLLTMGSTLAAVTVQSLVPGVATVAYAKTPDKGSDSSSDDSSSSSSGDSSSSSDSASAWNTALSQLSESAVSSSNSKTNTNDDNKSGKDQANIDTAIAGGDYLNVWGFMGNGNTDVWEKNNNSSWTVSYNSLIGGANSATGTAGKHAAAYKVAGRFAYALQSTGLDQPVKSGFTGVNVIDNVGGWVMQLSYFVLDSAESLFKLALSILSAVNPINWALYGAGSSNAVFAGLANVVHQLYQLMKGVGWAICGLILAASIGLAVVGVTVGTGSAHVGPARALLNVFANLLKRLFVWTVLPVFGLAFFGATIDNVQDAFETQSNSVPNYAVYGAFVDYNNWAMNSRLGLPSDVQLSSSFDSKKALPLTHNQILSINYKGAGVSGLSGLYNTVSSNGSALKDSSSSTNTSVDDFAKSVLKSWTSGSSITAADYASAADPDIRAAAKKSSGNKDGANTTDGNGAADLSSELVKGKYNYYGTNRVNSSNNTALITGNTFRPNSDTMSGTDRTGGLSTLGMYAYMLTTASDDKMTIADTENLSNDVAQPEHRATVLVGTGIVSTGNLVWAFGMMVGLALLVVGYLLEVLKTIIQSIPAITMSTFQTALMSLKGGIQFISVLAGLFIGVFGSAVMYMIAQLAYISIAEFSDQMISGKLVSGAVNLLSMQGDTSVGTLTSGAALTTIQGAANIAYGVFLIWLAVLLYRYRGIFVASLSSLVEETVNKIMATFGNLSGQGSSGTRGAIMQNSNTDNTWASNAAGLAKTAGMGALLAGGASGIGSAAKGLSGLGQHSANKDSAKMSDKNKEKEKENNSRSSLNSSANKPGNAAERTNSERSSLNNNMANGNRNNLANSGQHGDMPATDKNANGVADRNADRNQKSDANGNGLENTSYVPGNDSNSIGDRDDLTEANQDQLTDANANDLQNSDGDTNQLDQDQNQNGLNDNDLTQQDNQDSDALSQNSQGDTNQNGLNDNDLTQSDSQNDQNAGDELANNGDQNNLGQDANALGSDSAENSIGDSENGLSDQNNAATTGDAVADSARQQDQLGNELGVGPSAGDSNVANTLGDSNANATNALGDMSQRNSLGDNRNDLSTHVPVNSDMSAQQIQSQMGDVQNANESANTANSLASVHPNNQTLSQQATAADNSLKSMQSNVLRDYNQQAVTSGSPQSQWLSHGSDPKSISMGTANNAMNSVYNAQRDLGSATSRYGADSTQAKQATQQLATARQNAVHSGLSSQTVNDSKAVNAAHHQIAENASNLMKGTWKPQSSSGSNSVAHLGNDSGRTIGI